MPRGSTLVHTAGGSPIPGVVSESALRAESFSSSQSLFSLPGAAKGRRPLMNGLYKKGPRGRPGALLESGQKSDVVVEHELPWVRSQRDLVDLFLALVLDPGLDDILREDAALDEERVVLLERVQRFAERAGDRLDLRLLLALELVNVLVDRLGRKDLVLDSVQTRHQARSKGQVWVGGRVGGAELDPLGLRVGRVHRDAYACRAVPLRVDEVDRRLVAGHEPAVRVGGRRAQRQQRRRVLEQAAD